MNYSFEIKCNLRLFRLSEDLSQTELAELVGISKNAIHLLETGRIFPRLEVAYRIGYVLGVSVYRIWPCSISEV